MLLLLFFRRWVSFSTFDVNTGFYHDALPGLLLHGCVLLLCLVHALVLAKKARSFSVQAQKGLEGRFRLVYAPAAFFLLMTFYSTVYNHYYLYPIKGFYSYCMFFFQLLSVCFFALLLLGFLPNIPFLEMLLCASPAIYHAFALMFHYARSSPNMRDTTTLFLLLSDAVLAYGWLRMGEAFFNEDARFLSTGVFGTTLSLYLTVGLLLPLFLFPEIRTNPYLFPILLSNVFSALALARFGFGIISNEPMADIPQEVTDVETDGT